MPRVMFFRYLFFEARKMKAASVPALQMHVAEARAAEAAGPRRGAGGAGGDRPGVVPLAGPRGAVFLQRGRADLVRRAFAGGLASVLPPHQRGRGPLEPGAAGPRPRSVPGRD